MAAKGWITIHVHTYSKQSHNKIPVNVIGSWRGHINELLNLLVLAKITVNLFADLRRSVIDGSRPSAGVRLYVCLTIRRSHLCIVSKRLKI